eukprot:SAG31_NODE_358_length_17033_cov_11.747077_13_plen_154_part_00
MRGDSSSSGIGAPVAVAGSVTSSSATASLSLSHDSVSARAAKISVRISSISSRSRPAFHSKIKFSALRIIPDIPDSRRRQQRAGARSVRRGWAGGDGWLVATVPLSILAHADAGDTPPQSSRVRWPRFCTVWAAARLRVLNLVTAKGRLPAGE